MTSVDVVVPCYNYGHFLRECVTSVLAQEDVNVRVLIIDDCSPDNTCEVAWQLVAEDRRVQYRRHEVNRGHILTYNEGLLEWVAAEYCMVLSADDLLAPRALARATKVMTANRSVGMTYGRHIECSDAIDLSTVSRSEEDETFVILAPQQLIEFACKNGATEIASPTVVVRSDVQQRIGGYLEELPHSGDTEMWLRFARYSRVAALNAVQAYKREHARNMATTTFAALPGILQQLAAVEVHLKRHGAESLDVERLRQSLHRTIGERIAWGGMRALEEGQVAEARQYLQTALDVHASLPLWQYRWRTRLKRLVGPDVWSAARRLVRPEQRTTCGPPLPQSRSSSSATSPARWH
jgi:glycosyltransferase involved in cell wall biosynthesis